MLTGTDEHGEKVLRTALGNQTDPKSWTDKLVTESWLPLLETIDIDNQDFIRTTEPRHEVAVQKFLQKLYDDGYIYQGSFEGNYCVGCEEYKNDGDLIDGIDAFVGQRVCAIHSKPVEQLNETNYFFKLSQFKKNFESLRANPTLSASICQKRGCFICEIRLSDLSISRSKERFDWGIDILGTPNTSPMSGLTHS